MEDWKYILIRSGMNGGIMANKQYQDIIGNILWQISNAEQFVRRDQITLCMSYALFSEFKAYTSGILMDPMEEPTFAGCPVEIVVGKGMFCYISIAKVEIE